MDKIGLIPSRYKSSRFPGKPLELIKGIPMFVHVYHRAKLSKLDKVFVCTDDKRIYNEAKKYNIDALMTSVEHNNGTERCYEASQSLNLKGKDVILDIQGDEPLINPLLIDETLENFDPNENDICFPFLKMEQINDLGSVKIVTNSSNQVIYMSRSDIPNAFRKSVILKKQIGLIAFSGNSLKIFSETKESYLENIEGIELLRTFDIGLKVETFETEFTSNAVDYPKDIEIVNSLMETDTIFPIYRDKIEKIS